MYNDITLLREEKHRYYFKSASGKMVQPLWNRVWQVLIKLYLHSPCGVAICIWPWWRLHKAPRVIRLHTSTRTHVTLGLSEAAVRVVVMWISRLLWHHNQARRRKLHQGNTRLPCITGGGGPPPINQNYFKIKRLFFQKNAVERGQKHYWIHSILLLQILRNKFMGSYYPRGWHQRLCNSEKIL